MTTPFAQALVMLMDSLQSQKSILEYLHANNFVDAFNALKSDTGVEYTPDPKGKYVGLLEKKWTSVIRLQKKVRYVHLPGRYGPHAVVLRYAMRA